MATDDSLFPDRLHDSPHLGTRRCAGIVDAWVKFLGFVATHLMRLSNLKSVKISAMNDILTRPNGAGLAGGGSTMDS